MSSKNILVTGASRGIGYQTVLRLASEGHSVLCTARTAEKLNLLAREFPEQIIPVAADLSKNEDISHLISEINNHFGHVDLVIHNAGGIRVKPFEDLTDEDWKYLLDVNLLSAVRLFRGILPLLASGSHLLTIGSMGGFQGSSKFPGLSAYSVSKGTLAILSECLAGEFGKQGISVNCLCIGAVQTEMLETAFPGIKAPVSASEMAGYITDFGLTGHHFYNGRVLPVAISDPG